MLEESKAPVSFILGTNPEFSISQNMAGLEYRKPEDLERIESGLRKERLPE